MACEVFRGLQAAPRATRRRGPASIGPTSNFGPDRRSRLPRATGLDYG